MELKYLFPWESFGPRLFYQSYHRGIEMLKESGSVIELKKLSIVPSWNWNSTRGTWIRECGDVLSIVPSWNWNTRIAWWTVWAAGYQSYHRGIEICLAKSRATRRRILSIVPSWNWNDHRIHAGASVAAINRTIVELKYKKSKGSALTAWTINRTIVELKYILTELNAKSTGLSIVPSWN